MKKGIILMMAAIFVALSVPSFADTTTNFNQGNQNIEHRSNVPNTPIWKNREFWQNEKERSGLPHFWENTKNFFRKLNPMPAIRQQRERYDANRANRTSDVNTRNDANNNYSRTANSARATDYSNSNQK
jgi:hypothetical protein